LKNKCVTPAKQQAELCKKERNYIKGITQTEKTVRAAGVGFDTVFTRLKKDAENHPIAVSSGRQ
jgi:hypothetical protein